MSMLRKPTLMEYVAYELVRREGKFNMIMEAQQAAKAAGLEMMFYLNVLTQYNWCMQEWNNKRFIILETWIESDGVHSNEDNPDYYNLSFDDALKIYVQDRKEVPNMNLELKVQAVNVVFYDSGKHNAPGPSICKTCSSVEEAKDYIKAQIKKFGKPLDGYYTIECE